MASLCVAVSIHDQVPSDTEVCSVFFCLTDSKSECVRELILKNEKRKKERKNKENKGKKKGKKEKNKEKRKKRKRKKKEREREGERKREIKRERKRGALDLMAVT